MKRKLIEYNVSNMTVSDIVTNRQTEKHFNLFANLFYSILYQRYLQNNEVNVNLKEVYL